MAQSRRVPLPPQVLSPRWLQNLFRAIQLGSPLKKPVTKRNQWSPPPKLCSQLVRRRLPAPCATLYAVGGPRFVSVLTFR